MLTLFSLLLKPELFLQPFQDYENFSGVYCPYCESFNNNRTKRFRNTRSLYYHLREFHRNQNGIDFVIRILQSITYGKQIKMIK